MRPASELLDGLRTIFIAFYRWLLKLSINAHQVFTYWRTRIHREQRFAQRGLSTQQRTNVELIDELRDFATTATTSSSLSSPSSTTTTATTTEQHQHQQSNTNTDNSEVNLGQHHIGLKSSKTPHTKKFKLTSLIRRLSLRNFMEYCAIALNEASNSSCSNRFDLSSCNGIIWLIGRRYELPQDEENLTDDIRSRLWITYRKNFPPLDEDTRYTTDRGFGCMIRCGQMVLANALIYKALGRDWRWSPKGLDTNPDVYKRILKLFQDKNECLYSIHKIVQTGQKHEGKNIGEWFGPNTIAQALKRMSATYASGCDQLVDNETVISIDAALDNIVVIDEIKAKFKQKKHNPLTPPDEEMRNPKNGSSDANNLGADDDASALHKDKSGSDHRDWTPGILFIQLRLGLTKINPLYFAALKKTFQFKNSLGIIGGRPNHALYLVGYTDEDIIYLDPHSTQQYIDFDQEELAIVREPPPPPPSDAGDTSDAQQQQQTRTTDTGTFPQPLDITYHCSYPEKMSIDRLDPSLALCFYFSSERDFDEWCNLSQDLLIKSEQAPMFEITKSRPTDWNISLTSLELDYVMQ